MRQRPLFQSEPHDKPVMVHFTKSLLDAARKRAAAGEQSLGAFVRACVRKELSK